MREVKGVVACPVCDTLHQRPKPGPDQKARCRTCESELRRYSRLDRGRTIPLVLTCLLLFIIANAFPIVTFDMQGVQQPLTLLGAVLTLLNEGMIPVAMMVLLPTLLLPGMYLLLLLMTLLVVSMRQVPDSVVNRLVRMMQQLYPWSMVEVFLLGILVAMIKLSSMAAVVLGPALWAWMGTTITLTVVLTIDLRRLIRRAPLHGVAEGGIGSAPVKGSKRTAQIASTVMERRDASPDNGSGPASTKRSPARTGRDSSPAPTKGTTRGAPMSEAAAPRTMTGARAVLPTARSSGMIACLHCATVWADARPGEICQCCGGTLAHRRFNDMNTTWALLITAVILYIPANLMPMMITNSMFGTSEDTILSGVVYFWMNGEWFVAAVIFTASFLIPLFKLVALFMLALQVQRHSAWRLPERTRLYHAVEWVGRWSMLDVFVVAITAALIQRPGVAVILAGPGIAAFGAVVVLTMLAAMSFDPRLGWDARFGQVER
ncbi:MAG: paraquat-inducible protein A [Lautropia sp.]|nr:paraquat-inducible protein A [Lautropia sp.]